jgi:GntR family transcriptional regulator
VTSSLPLPRREGDGARLEHELLRIVRDAAASGSPLPGELEITARLGRTRQQVRKAMAALEAQGILRRRQGTVTTVDPIALRLSVRLEEQFEHTDLLDRLGYTAAVETLSARRGVLDADAAAAMEMTPGAAAYLVRKRWRADGAVSMIADDQLPVSADVEVDPARSVFEAVQTVWGEPVIWEVATPGVATLSGELADLFERPEGTPIMTFEIVGIGASGRRLMRSLEYHDPDIVKYSLVRTVRPPWGAAPRS